MARIYLCGPIAGTDYDTCAIGWRKDVLEALPEHQVYSPMRGKKFLKDVGTIEAMKLYQANPLSADQGIVARDVFDVRNCDLMFANFINAPRGSIGSAAEYGLAWAFGKPIITVLNPRESIPEGQIDPHDHPFIRGMSMYVVYDLKVAIDLVKVVLTPSI